MQYSKKSATIVPVTKPIPLKKQKPRTNGPRLKSVKIVLDITLYSFQIVRYKAFS